MLASSDWLKSDSIGESLTATYRIPAHLTVTKDNIEANLLFLNFMVHCATICVHRMAQKIVQTSSSPLRAKFVQQSASQCVAAASTVFRLTELAIQSNLRNVSKIVKFAEINLPVLTKLILVSSRHFTLHLLCGGQFRRLA